MACPTTRLISPPIARRCASLSIAVARALLATSGQESTSRTPGGGRRLGGVLCRHMARRDEVHAGRAAARGPAGGS